jgi:Tol biopolymer transport system component
MKRLNPVVIVIASASIALVATALPSARATPSGENGRIVFRRYHNVHQNRGAIFSIRADGTGERQITHPGRKVADNGPGVSPNGRWVVFSRMWNLRRTASGDHRAALFRIRMDGTHRQNLTGDSCRPAVNDCVRDIEPNWSPRGGRIAFSRAFRYDNGGYELDVFMMRANGAHRRRITHPGPGIEDYDPSWSTDGSRLAFFRFDPDRQSDAIFTVRTNGDDLQQLTPWRAHAALGVDWSPDGRWIIFSSKPEGQTGNLRMIHPDGTGLRWVTRATDAQWLKPCFSPDGTRIVASRTSGVGADGNADVFVMRLDGSHKRNITRTEDWDSAVDWGPRPT